MGKLTKYAFVMIVWRQEGVSIAMRCCNGSRRYKSTEKYVMRVGIASVYMTRTGNAKSSMHAQNGNKPSPVSSLIASHTVSGADRL